MFDANVAEIRVGGAADTDYPGFHKDLYFQLQDNDPRML